MSKASSRPTSGSSLSSRRRMSILPLGHLERLARVRFLTLPFSRQPSRRRMAGGEFRLGTVSMYMGIIVLDSSAILNLENFHYMGTISNRPELVLSCKSISWSAQNEINWGNFGLNAYETPVMVN